MARPKAKTKTIDPEDRKAMARRRTQWAVACGLYYPKCCNNHMGYDEALASLEVVHRDGVTVYVIEGES